MNILTAHGLFCQWSQEEREATFPGRYILDGPGGSVDSWPAVAVGAVLLTGWLPTLEPEELGDALRQGLALLESGVKDQNELVEETYTVLKTIQAWGEGLEKSWPEYAAN